jgi:hypothetical protein
MPLQGFLCEQKFVLNRNSGATPTDLRTLERGKDILTYTRSELLEVAKELNISADPKWSKGTLTEQIKARMQENGLVV